MVAAGRDEDSAVPKERQMPLAGQVALVTGASRGLGESIARALAKDGARMACMARPGAELDAAVARLANGGHEAMSAAADVTNRVQVESAVQQVLERWGRIDMLVLNAGGWKGALVHETSDELWDQMLNLNLKGAFHALRATLPSMMAARAGTIVGISSIGGLVGSAGSAAYAASKWGLRGLLESTALEVKAHRIRVSIVHPHDINSAGATYRDGTPERDQHVEPEDVAAVVAFLVSAPSHVSIGNVTVWPLAAGVGLR